VTQSVGNLDQMTQQNAALVEESAAAAESLRDQAAQLAQAVAQLQALGGKTHHLYSALVIYENGLPIWRHIGHARLTMRTATPSFLTEYVARNWHSIQHSVGGYKIEEEGLRLFTDIEGDTFTIQGLPLLPLINYLIIKGVMAA
ncbi:MAG: Maf family protein, partial [Cypionkella sp.]